MPSPHHAIAVLCLFLTLNLVGCGQSDTAPATSDEAETTPDATLGEPATSLGEPETTAAAMEVPAGDQIALTPENTTIQFVGVHTDPAKPDPRTGQFEKFNGTAVVDGSELKYVSVEIDTTSLTTEIDKLTGHLKSPDFFNVNEHPKSTFQPTAIESTGDGKVTVTGNLTLLGKTQSVSFPATVSTEGGLKLDAEFEIDRTQFGMDYGTDNVKKEVAMTIKVDG